MDEGSVRGRRPAGAWRERARRLGASVRAGLSRTLAEDDDRVAYWLRHVRHGVVLSEVSAVAVLIYVLLTHTPGRQSPFLLAMGIGVVLASPVLFVLPLETWLRDRRGPLLFYSWSVADTLLITIAARLDGGASSPLFSVLFITLAYMAVAYPPHGVVAMGALMTGAYLLLVALPRVTSYALFFAAVMGLFTLICAMASANSWNAYDRSVLLLRAREALAATDPLTGCPNRREFLERLGRAIDDAAGGCQAVVCLIDLDGFKAVNDRDGHAAGDAVLRDVTAALGAAVRETDTVARLGGDEFAVLAAVDSALPPAVLAERLRSAVHVTGRDTGVTASVGVAVVQATDDVNLLLHRADAAMYRAKTSGGNRVTTPVG